MVTITSGAVCMRLGVDRHQLTRWGYRGYLYGGHQGYELTALNAFLAKYVRNADITWEHMLLTSDAFVSAERAQAQLGISSQQFSEIVQGQPVAYARFPGKTYRYSLAGLWQTLPHMVDRVSLWLAARALACTERDVMRMFGDASSSTSVVRQSLYRVLRSQLPAWVDPEDWLYDCEIEPPLTVERTAELLGMSVPRLHGVLSGERAPFIVRENTLRKKRMWVSPLWVWAYFMREQPLTDQQVARLLGVTPQAANYWKQSGREICSIPGHEHSIGHPDLWPLCWVEYLRNNCNPAFRGSMYAFSLGQIADASPLKLYSTGQAQRAFGLTGREVERLMSSDRVLVIRTPGGEYRIAPAWRR